MVDYVIVGAGSAGCVLAARLLAAGYRVALIEAGGRDDRPEIRVPAAFTRLFKTDCDWGYHTVAQPALDGRELFWPRGKVLGGCSSINAQMWLPGYPADYDAWAECGNPGWGWDDVRPHLERAKRSASSGSLGLDVAPLRDPNPTTAAFLRACEEVGLPRLGPPEHGRPEGFSLAHVTQRRGARCSVVDGYLRPFASHARLSLVLAARVERVLFEGRTAVGVTLADAAGGRRDVLAAREVVLAAGAINSPHLLLLSGVGEPAALAAHGIAAVCALPGVGRNLQDHLMAAVVAACPKPVTLRAATSLPSVVRYALTRRGMLASNVAEAYAFARTRAELRLPDVELVFAPTPFVDHGLAPPSRHAVTVAAVLLQPESRGRVALRSADPVDAPRIDPAYLSDPSGTDLRSLAAGVRLARRVLSAGALREYVDGFLEPGPSVGDGEGELAAFVRARAETLYHPVGTCRMGDDEGAVVDAALRVRGVDRLRVVDASVMPRIVRGHTHAPTVAIAERAAELIVGAAAPLRAAVAC